MRTADRDCVLILYISWLVWGISYIFWLGLGSALFMCTITMESEDAM